jgi:hypothetical protein
MNSFLIGYDPVKKKSEEEAWVHINLWEEKKPNNIIIDFGILVRNIKEIKAINIYSPYDIEEVKDIVTILEKNKKLITAVFNENYQYKKDLGNIIQPQRGDPFVLSSANIKHDKNRIILDTGKINYEKSHGSYFRVRLILSKEKFNEKCKEFIFAHKSKGSRFSDFFTSTEIIDFRLNDSRSGGSAINVGNFFHIRSVNYFILRDPSEVIIYYGNAMRNSRYLESDIWEGYELPDGLIAYHLYRKAKRIEVKENENTKSSYDYIDHFSELVRFQCQRKRYLITALSIIVFTLLLGSISGFLGNLLSAFVDGLCK